MKLSKDFCYIHLITGQTLRIDRHINDVILHNKFLTFKADDIQYVKAQKNKDGKDELLMCSKYNGQKDILVNTKHILYMENFSEQ